jgi:hypothetical protein
MSTAEAVTVSVSAFAGVIATTTELVSEKLVSFASETRTLQVPLDRLIVTKPVEELTLQAVLVLVSKLNVPVKFGTAPTPKERLVV